MRHARAGFVGLLIIALVGGLSAYAIHKIRSILVLRIATGPAGSFGAQFSTSLVHLVALDRPRLRVTSIAYPSDDEALKALQDGRADVAIARADEGASPPLTIAVIRHDAGLFVLPHNAKADSVAGLRGETIGVVGASPRDMDLFGTVRDFYGLPAHPDPVSLAPGDVADAIRTRKVQAIYVVGAIGGSTLNQVIAAVKSGGGGPPRLLPVDESDAIVKRNHRLESVSLPKGVLQGAPPLPDDDISTLGVSTRIFATAAMPDEVAAELTRILLTDKPKVASLLPKSAIVEPPETDKLNASLPVHSGTAAYLTGNQPSLSDELQNFLYWLGIIGSLLATCIAGLAAMFRRLLPRQPKATLKMLDLWVAVRDAPDEAALRMVEADVDALVHDTIRKQAAGQDEDLNPAFPLVVGQVKRTIDRKRVEWAGAAAGAAARTPAPRRDEAASA